jgi:mannose-6-phosphate isomerase-like protein (cupin superfamily)
MEAVYYIIEGSGSVSDPSAVTDEDLIEGSMIFVEPNTPYVIRAGIGGIELMGGPCPPDPALYAHL